MKILFVLSAFPPHYLGGGEDSAISLARWLVKNGHDISFVTAADKNEAERRGEHFDGMHIWRLHFPRPYMYWDHRPKASIFLKLLWHLQDNFHPRNRRLMASALDEVKPECVLIHVPAGIGYNALREIGKRDIPAVYVLHDLKLACFWGAMFKKNGEACDKQCLKCRIISHIRFSAATSIPRLGFCSPSRANLEKAASVLPLYKYKTAAIFNVNTHPTPSASATKRDYVRFIYVGRMTRSKGVDFLLSILEKLSAKHRFTITLLGDGADREAWSARFGRYDWCRFKGHVSQQEVSDAMVQSDVLCLPTVYWETLGGVVIHALELGLPAIGSDVGGIPELIDHDRNGLLLPPGDVAAWEEALRSILENPAKIEEWRAYAEQNKSKFDQDRNGRKIEAFVKEVILSNGSLDGNADALAPGLVATAKGESPVTD